jgi:dihydrofolate reductase
MGKTIMNVAAVSLDGFIADDNDGIEPLFDWLDNGDVTWSSPGIEHEFRTTQASADFTQTHYRDVAAAIIGRRLFDLTNRWNGKIECPGEHVFVVTHQPPQRNLQAIGMSTSSPARSAVRRLSSG